MTEPKIEVLAETDGSHANNPVPDHWQAERVCVYGERVVYLESVDSATMQPVRKPLRSTDDVLSVVWLSDDELGRVLDAVASLAGRTRRTPRRWMRRRP